MHIKTIQQKQQKIIKEKNIKKSPHTAKKYKTAFKHLNNYLEQENIQTINNNTITDILKGYEANLIKQGYNDNTINQYMILATNLITKECKLTPEKIERLTIIKKEPHYIEENQYTTIIKHLEKQQEKIQNTKDKKTIDTDKTLITLLYTTGLRIHEALNLTIAEITNAPADINNIHQIQIIGKGRKARYIFIIPAVYTALIEYIQTYQQPGQIYIFESTSAKQQGQHRPLTTRTINRHFQRIAKQLDAKYAIDPNSKNSYTNQLKPHSLRHSFAVNNINKTGINTMQKLLGHSSIATTQIYADVKNNALSDAMAKAFNV